jgi:hypothetical protein
VQKLEEIIVKNPDIYTDSENPPGWTILGREGRHIVGKAEVL